MTSRPSPPLLLSAFRSQSCVGCRWEGKQSRACRGALTLGLQLPSSNEETRGQERGNTARERWGRGTSLSGERGKRAPPFLGIRVKASEQVLLVCPESRFHLTVATCKSCLRGHLCGLVRPTLCFHPFPLLLLLWLLHVEGRGLCCQSVHGSSASPSWGILSTLLLSHPWLCL